MEMPSAQKMLSALRGAGYSDNRIAGETGLSQPTISRIRSGDQIPTIATWQKINKLYASRPRGASA